MMKQYVRAGLAALAVLFFMLGCAPQKAVWLNDFEEAQALAKTQNKNIFLYFSAQDWDGKSEALKTTIFDTDDFLKGIAKKYIPVNLDFSNSTYEQAEIPDGATEEQIAAAETSAAIIEKNANVAQKYSVMEIPAFYLLTNGGIVISQLDNIADADTPSEFIDLISQSDEKAAKVNSLIKTIDKSTGAEKVTAIDSLFEELDARYRPMISEYFPLVIENDPENTTGLLGKYEFQKALTNALNFASIGMSDLAYQEFIEVSDSAHFSAGQKQQALYFAAFFLDRQPGKLEDVLALLQRAYDADPESKEAPDILETMESIRGQIEQGDY
jgi:thioredoxin-related protein